MSWIKENKLKFIIILFIIILGFIVIYFLNDNFSAIKNDPFSTSKINILIAGYDSSINGPPRADTIMIASIDMDSNDIGVLFIPRDTRLEIPGHGIGKINASHAYGGIELTDKTLENFLDIPIDYYVETDFYGFTDIIDSIGGVNLHIEKPLYYVDKAGGVNINLPAGDVHLNGEESLDYVRYRGRIKGDIGRVERQQKFVKAVIDKILSPEIIVKLPNIYNNVMKSVNTNIPIKDVTPFLKVLKNMNLNNLKTEMIPGEPKYINGVSYWLADRNELNILVDNLIRSKEYIKNSQYDLFIYNGNGESGLAGEVADSLEKYGFKIDEVGNASNFDYETTLINYFEKGDKKVASGIKKIIGGELNYLERENKGINIILGHDYLEKENKENE